MKDFLKKLINSLDNKTDGFSGRKLSALVGVLTGVYITAVKLPADAQINALYAWLGFALLCLGIVTIEQIMKLKNGNEPTA
jgi:uncharacterized membrane protein HdeD (DUF308 family)